MLLVGRPQSFRESNPQPGKPSVLICPSALILVLSLGSSMPSRAKRTPPKTLLFPVAVSLLTLPITMPLIFAHIYLKQHPVPRAEPKSEFPNFPIFGKRFGNLKIGSFKVSKSFSENWEIGSFKVFKFPILRFPNLFPKSEDFVVNI